MAKWMDTDSSTTGRQAIRDAVGRAKSSPMVALTLFAFAGLGTITANAQDPDPSRGQMLNQDGEQNEGSDQDLDTSKTPFFSGPVKSRSVDAVEDLPVPEGAVEEYQEGDQIIIVPQSLLPAAGVDTEEARGDEATEPAQAPAYDEPVDTEEAVGGEAADPAQAPAYDQPGGAATESDRQTEEDLDRSEAAPGASQAPLTPVGAWTPVGVWLHSLGLGQYEPAFRANHITAAVLPHLTLEDLKDLGITSVGHRRILLDAIAAMAATAEAEPALASTAPGFEGMYATRGNTRIPPDPVGDVSPKYYVQMVNNRFAIWEKDGTLAAGPFEIGSLFSQNTEETPCDDNYGDPIVLYDEEAGRWLLSQFAVPSSGDYYECIAISQNEDDPVSGKWWVYEFSVPEFPDYPKLGVWHDAYYMSTYEGSQLGVFAFDRASMLRGDEASYVRFTLPSLGDHGRAHTRILPSDFDGAAPPEDRPNWFVRSVDDELQSRESNATDQLEIYEFVVDFENQEATFERVQTLPTAPYAIDLCGSSLPRSCMPQPDTGATLDPLSNRLMARLQYRNFGDFETLVAIQTVNIDGHAGIRWYELRRSGNEPWEIARQEDLSPDDTNRWMGSAAMDRLGNISIGYNVSSQAVFPGIRYTIIPPFSETVISQPQLLVAMETPSPLEQQPEGHLAVEHLVVGGAGSQTSPSSRWGDYSSMSVDPTDQCTFWYTAEYYDETTQGGWRTRIAHFSDPVCTP